MGQKFNRRRVLAEIMRERRLRKHRCVESSSLGNIMESSSFKSCGCNKRESSRFESSSFESSRFESSSFESSRFESSSLEDILESSSFEMMRRRKKRKKNKVVVVVKCNCNKR